ncbi:MAG: peptidase S10 [Hyphomicrobiaceae bacterium]|nr:peptidase S10 [Hyphomicrobiaceae bacterium]
MLIAASTLLATSFAAAEPVAKADKPTTPPAIAATAKRPAADAFSRHTITIGTERIDYTATAGTLPLVDAKGETQAHIFYTAYTVTEGGPRPVTFVFNGGPGAASAFLHLGAIGPRVIAYDAEGANPIRPVKLEDNPDSWLDVTDLVFVDPVETGYSRAPGGEDAAKDRFFGVDKDADALAETVRLYLTRNGRLLDPVFIAGESYGGFRAALLVKRLLASGLDVRGAVLISPAVEFSLIRGDDVLLLPDVLALPSIAASHAMRTSGAEAAKAIRAEAEAFARGPYLMHVAAGRRDNPEINAALARYTGLPIADIARNQGRVSVRDYAQAYRRANDRVLSLYDGAVDAAVPRPATGHHADPVLDRAVTVLGPAMAAYTKSELGYATDLDYRLLNRSVSRKWDFGSSPQRQGYAGALDDLEDARALRPSLAILFATGETDLVTPYATSRYLIDQMKPLDGATPVAMTVYAGGHMMYLRRASRAALAADARAHYAGQLGTAR